MTIWQGKSFGLAGMTVIISGKLIRVIATDSEKKTISIIINDYRSGSSATRNAITSSLFTSNTGTYPKTYVNPFLGSKQPQQEIKGVESHPFDEPIKFFEEILDYLKKEKMVENL